MIKMAILLIALMMVSVGFLSGCVVNDYIRTPNPYASMTANPVNHSCMITIETISPNTTRWTNIWYTLVDITNSKHIFNGTAASASNATIILPRTGQVKVGQTITITPAGTWAQGNPLDNKTQYSFGLIYNATNDVVGEVNWTQP